MIVGFDYTITGHAYKICPDCPVEEDNTLNGDNFSLDINSLKWQLSTASEGDGLSNGLTWKVNQLDWDDANSYCDNLVLSGRDDWRLPSKDELVTTIDTSLGTPPYIINDLRETTIQNGSSYWTSDINQFSNGHPWYVYYGDGQTHSNFMKSNLGFYVRCVTDVSSQNGNHAYREIFRVDAQHTVTEGTNTLDLRLSPLLDDRELTVPRITRINRPFQMEVSTSDNITVKVDSIK